MRHTKRYGSIAQLGEHLPYKQRVIGSSPIVPTTIFLTYGSIAQLGEHLPYKQRVIGSSPIVPTICGPVVQLVRMPACHAGGRGFEPHPDRHYSLSKLSCFASVAQSVEQGTENPRVGGSIPPGGTIFSMSAVALIEKIIPPSQGIESWLLEICRWHISTSVAFAAAKAIPPGEVASERQVTRLRVKESR